MPLSQNVISDTKKSPCIAAPVAVGFPENPTFLPQNNARAGGRGNFCPRPMSAPPSLSRKDGVQDAQSGVAAGLVPSLTSDTLVLNPKEIRHKRLYRAVKTSARLHEQDMQGGGFRFRSWFVTLTYAGGVAWKPRHISDTLNCVRSWCARLGVTFRYVWVSEVQEKRQHREGGHCVHYHLLIFLPVALQLPKFDKRGWWPHGMTETVRAIKPVSYMAKYASKGGTASLPKGARMHGTGGLSKTSKLERAWWLCPAYIREHWQDYALKPQRAKGGGWIAKTSGEWLPSLYKIISYNPLVVIRVDTS